jgi:glycosyltransferase involved in cell wall biosynthesis
MYTSVFSGQGGENPAQRLRVMRVLSRMNIGGPALQAVALARGLDAARFDHRLYAGSVRANEADYIASCAAGVPVTTVPGLGRQVRPLDDIRALTSLTAAIRRFQPHIVHTHTAKAGALGRLAALAAGTPARVHTFHGHLLRGYFSEPKTRALVRTERMLARTCDRLVSVGAQVRDDLLAAGIGTEAQYVVVPPGTRLRPLPGRDFARRRLGLPPQVPVVAYVGRLAAVKRPDRLGAVIREVGERMPAARFVVCGDGERGLLSTTSDLAIEPLLLGWRADVETVYAAADVVILTSDNEGMPVCLIEAALAGVPAVATRVGSVAEVVEDGVTGLLAEPRTDELASHVVRLLGDAGLRARMGCAARLFAEQRFGEQRLVADIDRLYTSIAERRGWWPQKAVLKEGNAS